MRDGTGLPAPSLCSVFFSSALRAGRLRNGTPLGDILQRGFGYVVVPQGGLVRHNEVEFQNGIHPLFYRSGPSFPKANEWV